VFVHPEVAAMLCVPLPVIVKVHGVELVTGIVAGLGLMAEKLFVTVIWRGPTMAGV